MKWFSQYFLAPALAAFLAVSGNYYFIQKPSIEKDYTKIGLDVLLNEKAPENLRLYAEKLLNQNSPLPVSESDKEKDLKALLKNIPAPSDIFLKPNTTYGEILDRYVILASWIEAVRKICPECLSEDVFNDKLKKLNKE